MALEPPKTADVVTVENNGWEKSAPVLGVETASVLAGNGATPPKVGVGGGVGVASFSVGVSCSAAVLVDFGVNSALVLGGGVGVVCGGGGVAAGGVDAFGSGFVVTAVVNIGDVAEVVVSVAATAPKFKFPKDVGVGVVVVVVGGAGGAGVPKMELLCSFSVNFDFGKNEVLAVVAGGVGEVNVKLGAFTCKKNKKILVFFDFSFKFVNRRILNH